MIKNRLVSPQATFKAYPHWATEAPPLPPRSRLFRLEPIGIGTPEVECLTSYIARLAAEHCVSPRKLFCKYVLAPVGKHTVHYSASPGFSASLINGMGNLAGLTADAMEILTLRHDLRHTTLLVWKEVISTHLLLRTKKAWCSICYEEMLKEGRPIYDPLTWTLKVVSLCPLHHKPLRRTCPHCGQESPFLTTSCYPGFCSKCQQWLGNITAEASSSGKKLSPGTVGLARQVAKLHSISQLLSGGFSVSSPPTLQIFIANLAQYIEQNAEGSINLFSDLVGIWSGTVRRLLLGETKLTLEMLCQLCSRLNISPLDLLSDKGHQAMLEKRHFMLRRDTPLPNKVVPWNEVENGLKTALRESPPPSLEAATRRMGYNPPKVKRHFPGLCEKIASRYWRYVENRHPSPSEVRKVFRTALKEQPPPSLQRILRRLGCRDTGYYYYYNYRDLCLSVTHRYKEHRNKPFNKDADGKRLQAALAEQPPPSFSEVAKRLCHTREFIRKKFPELSMAVVSRYLHYQAALRKETAEKLRHAIRVSAQEIAASEQYVSEARVREHLRQHLPKIGRDSLFKQALREVKLELGLTK